MSPNPYCEAEPYQLRVWDQTALAGLLHCPRYHWLAQIRGLRPGVEGFEGEGEAGGGDNVNLEFGHFIHVGADIYAKARASGASPDLATDMAVEHVLDVTFPEGKPPWGGQYREVWQCTDRTRSLKATAKRPAQRRCPWSKAEHLINDRVEGDKCLECGSPAERRIAYIPTDKYKNRHTLIRSLVALCDALTASDMRPKVLADGRIGSELRWLRELPVKSPDGTPYMMTGSFDGVEEIGDGEEIVGKELKTTKRQPNESYFLGLETGVQVYTYSWALDGEFPNDRPSLWIVVIQVGIGFTEIHFRPVRRTRSQFDEWEKEIGFWVSLAEDLARSARLREEAGQDPADAFPRNPTACMHMPGAPTTPCPFLKFCHMDPRVRDGFIRGNFREERWNPLGTKGTEIPEEETEGEGMAAMQDRGDVNPPSAPHI